MHTSKTVIARNTDPAKIPKLIENNVFKYKGFLSFQIT